MYPDFKQWVIENKIEIKDSIITRLILGLGDSEARMYSMLLMEFRLSRNKHDDTTFIETVCTLNSNIG